MEARLDLEATLYSGQAFRWRRLEDGWHLGFVRNEPIRVRADRSTLDWRGGPRLSQAHVEDYFRLDGTHERFLADVRRDPQLDAALAAFRGLRLLRQDPWEMLVAFIISQNSNEAKIRRTIERLAERAGEAVGFEGQRLFRFPDPEALARLRLPELRATGMGYRSPYVREAARRVARGDLDPAALGRMPYEAALAELVDLPGVAEKVADCILLYGCGHLSAFPTDVWVRRFMSELYVPERPRPTPGKLRALALERFGPEAGYAQHFLFHYRRTVGPLPASGNGVTRSPPPRGSRAAPRAPAPRRRAARPRG